MAAVRVAVPTPMSTNEVALTNLGHHDTSTTIVPLNGNEVKVGSVLTPLTDDTIRLKSAGGYTTLLHAINQRMPPTPTVTITYKDLTVQEQVPVKDPGIYLPTAPIY
jgi:hypothetical protein